MRSRTTVVAGGILLLLAGGLGAVYLFLQGGGDSPAVNGAAPVVDVVSVHREDSAGDPRTGARKPLPQPAEASSLARAATPPAGASAPRKATAEAAGPHSISGMVMDESGRGVFGVPVTAYARSLFGEEGASAPDRTVPSMALTDVDGFYDIDGIADGEYRLRTEPDNRYEAAEAIVRAGAEGADLILRERRPGLEVAGTVRGDGEPLAGAEVVAVGQPSGAVLTDENGFYETTLEMTAGKSNYTLRFTREGYRERRSVLTVDDQAGPGRIRVDADLEPAQAIVEVTGSVRDRESKPAAGETVQLYSGAARQRYTAVSGRRGEIRFPEVETSDDYMLSVRPADTYRDYLALDVEIGVAGADLDIVLEPRSYGQLTGQMVDADGQPLPAFSLWLRNSEALNQPPLLVTGDQQGYFEVDRVEAGPLVFETRGSPLVSITGARIAPGEAKTVSLVLDWGVHQIAGLVMDEMGQPVSASELYITSVRRGGGLRAQAVRRAVTDETGYFLVGQLGSGYHTVRVDAPGYRVAIVDHEVGTDNPEVVIRLERAYSHGM